MTVHYHGTPITPNDQLLAMAGASFCVSYARPDQVRLCHEIGESVMLDNGAFSVWKRGHVPDWTGFYAWADEWLDYPTSWAVIPDVIEGDELENDLLCRAWPHGREKGAPVWHMHEGLNRLLGLLHTFPRVCIGSSAQYAKVLSPTWVRRMDETWRAIDQRFSRRTPVVHMLRGLQLARERWPFASVDSTDIARNHGLARNSSAKMRARWDAAQCPANFEDPGEQLEFVA